MNKISKVLATIGTAAGVALGGLVVTAPASQAYTVTESYYVSYRCIGPDLWGGKTFFVDYSWWEEISYPWPKDYSYWKATSLYSHNSSRCSSTTYA